jgi:hypothetical protein
VSVVNAFTTGGVVSPLANVRKRAELTDLSRHQGMNGICAKLLLTM